MVDINNQVGIEVEIYPNSDKVDRYLAKLQRDIIKVTAELQIDTSRAMQDIKNAIADKLIIPVELEIDSAKFEKKLEELTKDKTVKVKLEVDEDQAQKGIQNAASGVNVKANTEVLSPKANANFSNQFKTDFKPNINFGGGGDFDSSGIIKQIQECCNHLQQKLDETTETVTKAIFNSQSSQGLKNESVSALKSAIGAVGQTALFPVQKLLTGTLEGIGQGLTKDIGLSINKALGQALKLDGDKVGTEVGLAFGKAIRTQLENIVPGFVQKFNKPIEGRGQKAEGRGEEVKEEAEGRRQKAEGTFSQFKLQLANIKGVLIAIQKQSAGLESAVESLVTAFNNLNIVTGRLVESFQRVANRAGISTRKDDSVPSASTNQSGKRGFIGGDPKSITKTDVKAQIQDLLKTLDQLNKEIADSSNVVERNKKLQKLLTLIKQKRSQITADSKNENFSSEIKRSLSAYNKANGSIDRLEKLIISRLKKAQMELGQLNREQALGGQREGSRGQKGIVNNTARPNLPKTSDGDLLFRKGIRERGSEAVASKIGEKIGNAIARKIFEVLSGKKSEFSKIKVKDLANKTLDKIKVNANKVEVLAQQQEASNKNLLGKLNPFNKDRLSRTSENKPLYKEPDLKSLQRSQQEAIKNYLKVFHEVIKRSGIDPKSVKGNIPQLKSNPNLRSGEGLFNPGSNTVELSQSAIAALAKNDIGKEDLTALIHEFRHALQTAFGKLGIKDIARGAAPGVNLINGRTRQGEESTTAFVENRRNQGKSTSKAERNTVRALENDAELFARKTAKAIAAAMKADRGRQTADGRRQPFQHQKAIAKMLVIHAQKVLVKAEGREQRVEGEDRLARTTYRPNRLDAALRKMNQFLDRLIRDRGGISDRDERSQLKSEVGGFLASASILNFPGTSFDVITAPLQVALAPFIATIGLATKVLSPFVNALSETLKVLVPLNARFEAVAGSKAGGAQLKGFTEDISKRLNLPILGTAEQFSKIAAAAKGTKLEGEGVEELFEGISLSIKALGLSTQDSFLVFQGFLQILSKNRLSFEELRLQIAERFPPAIGVFSRALGVSTEQLNKLVEKGITGEEALSKVSKQLKLEFGEAGKAAANNYISALTRIENATFKLQASVAGKLEGVFTATATAIAKVLETLTSNVDRAFTAIATIVTGLFAQVLVGAAFVGTTAKFKLFGKELTLLGFAFEAITPVFSRLYVALTPFAAGIFADLIDDFASIVTGKEVKSSVQSITDGMFQLVYSIIATGETIADVLQPAFKSISNGANAIANFNLFDVFDSLVMGINALKETAKDILRPIKNSLDPAIQLFKDFSNEVSKTVDVLGSISVGLGLDGVGKAIAAPFVGVGVGIDKVRDKLVELLNLGSSFTLSLKDIGGFLGDLFGDLFNLLRSAIAFAGQNAALLLAVVQTIALGKFLVAPIVAAIVQLKLLGSQFIKTGLKGKVFKNIIATLKAGLSDFELQASIAITALLAFFSSADLFPEFRKELDKLKNQTNNFADALNNLPARKDIDLNLNIKADGDDLGDNADNKLQELVDKQSQFKSKGFDLTLGFGDILGTGSIRTDDFIKFRNKVNAKEEKNLGDRLKQIASSSVILESVAKLFNKQDGLLTLAEKQANDLLKAIDNITTESGNAIIGSGLLSSTNGEIDIFNTEIGKSLDSVKGLDEQIRKLSTQRATKLIDNPDADIKDIDAQLESLLKERKIIIKPAIEFRDDLLKQKAKFEQFIENIENSNQPDFIKEDAIKRLKNGVNEVDRALKQVRNIGLEADIDPLAEQFNNVSKAIEESTKNLEKLNIQLEKTKLESQLKIAESLAAGNISEEDATKQNKLIDKESIKRDIEETKKFLTQQRNNLFELLKIPESEKNEKTTEAIANQIKTVNELETSLGNKRISLANMVVEAKKDAEQEIIKDFNDALTERRQLIEKEFADNQQRVLEAQVRGDIDEEVAAEYELDFAIENTIDRLKDKKKELKEVKKLRKDEIDLLDESLQKEGALVAEIDQLENDLLSKRIEKIKSERDTRIRAIEKEAEARTAATNGIAAYIEKEKRIIEQYIGFIDSQIFLLQSKIGLDSSFGRVDEAKGNAEIAQLEKALELREKANDKELSFRERIAARNQLSRLGLGSKSEEALLDKRQKIENQIAKDKAIALAREQEQQRKLLELEEKRRMAVAQTSIIEANITKLKANQQLLEATGQKRKAEITGDEDQIAIANIGLEIARQQISLADQGIKSAKDKLNIEQQLAKETKITRLNEQLADRINATTDNATTDNPNTDNPNVENILPTKGLENEISRLQGFDPRNINARGFSREIPTNLQDYQRFLENIRIPQQIEVPQREVNLEKINQSTALVGNTSEIINLVKGLLEMQRNGDLGGLNVENISINNRIVREDDRAFMQEVARRAEQGVLNGLLEELKGN